MATSVNPLLAKLQAALSGKPDVVPTGWFTREEWMKKFGRGSAQTARLLSAGVSAGILEKQIFRIETKHSIRPIPHWREVK